jgi:SAM-dependent methyltransferase
VDPLQRVRAGYDAVADRYAAEIGDELAGKPVERAMYACFAELVGPGARVGDVGCGPGHVSDHLAVLGLTPVGVDPSPGMIAVARSRYPHLEFHVGSFDEPGDPTGSWAGAVAPYSLIHVEPADRPAAYAGLARTIASGGWLIVSFHTSDADHQPESIAHLSEWWGHDVDIDFHYLDPAEVAAGLGNAGFTVMATVDRQPWPDAEHPSRRCTILAHRDDG